MRPAGLALVSLFLVGCGVGDRPALSTAVDSSGVRLVSYEQGYVEAAPRWQVSGTPVLEIGVRMGDPSHEFSRIIGITPYRLGFLVADGGTNLIRYYDMAGAHLLDLGGTGEGPGEFRRLAWIQLTAGDSLYAWDSGLERLSVWSPELDLVRSEPTRLATNRPTVVLGAVSSQRLLVSVIGSSAEPPLDRVRNGRVNLSLASITDGDTVVTMAEVDGRPVYISKDGVVQPVPFTTLPSHAISRSGVYVGNGISHELRRYPFLTEPDLIVRLPRGDNIDATERAQHRAEYLRGFDAAARERQARVYDLVPQPQAAPSFGAFLTSPDGLLWIRRFRMPSDSNDVWVVLDDRGDVRGRVILPVGVEPQGVTRERIFARFRDTLGVHSVVVYRYEPG